MESEEDLLVQIMAEADVGLLDIGYRVYHKSGTWAKLKEKNSILARDLNPGL